MRERYELVHVTVNGVKHFRIDAVDERNWRRTQDDWKFDDETAARRKLAELKASLWSQEGGRE